MSHKVLVVGLDGATFDIIHPMVAEGRLPNLARMLKQGSWGSLRSNIPPVTPSAWTSVFTGKNPGKHGIYDFQEIDPTTYQFHTVRTDQHREKTVWQLLGEVGLRSIVMDVPFTYPPRPLHGLMITGYGTPRAPGTVFTYPKNIAASLPQNLHQEIRMALPTHKFDRSQNFIDEWQEVMAGRNNLLNHLIENEEWDFFMVVFSITDNMAHVFWTYVDPAHPNYYKPEGAKYREAFLHGYEMCDRLLGELVEKGGTDTTTLVLSDHGFGSVRPRQYVYKRLLQGGFLQPKGGNGKVSWRTRVVKTAVNTYTRFPFLREWVKGLQPKRRGRLIRSLKSSGIMPTDGSVDYTRSKVIPSNFGLRMWINDDERFPQGTVPAKKKGDALSELSDFLKSDRDPTNGKPIIANTFLGSDLYHGPFADQGPDLVIEYANFYQPNQSSSVRNPHVEGGHTLDGIFLAQGPYIQKNEVKNCSLIDLAPTILYLLDQPIPPDMDGRVITDILAADYLTQRPVQFGDVPATVDEMPDILTDGYSDEEEEEIQEQLRQLGYIE
ncbi:MAG: alkaline phosphatase family protein [Ardenticatenaceae bacterium]|nr:alkaline phosphatase family protein [Ardenticatenaceae bacterium]